MALRHIISEHVVPGALSLSSNLNTEVADKQKILETAEHHRPRYVYAAAVYAEGYPRCWRSKHEIQKKVHTDIDQQQRDYFLRQQI